MRTIGQVLDRAKQVQKVASDYKLALCLGIGESALANYRKGRSLPDEKACKKIASAIGEDAAVLAVEMQVQRSKDEETRALWMSIAKRLQAGFASVSLMAVLAAVLIAGSALSTRLGGLSATVTDSGLYIMLSRLKTRWACFSRHFVTLCKFCKNVSRKQHPAVFVPS